jgi:hypothetical protein
MRTHPDTTKLTAIPDIALLPALLPTVATARGSFDITGTTIVSPKRMLTGRQESAREAGYDGISLDVTGQPVEKV